MSKGKILVVDDEIYIVHILDFSLGMEGYEVVTALDGEQALEKVKTEKPDLIVLDIMMPKLDGYEVCKNIKSSAATQHIPVILLSAKGGGGDGGEWAGGRTAAAAKGAAAPKKEESFEEVPEALDAEDDDLPF